MNEFLAAARQLLIDEIHCPKCKARNKPAPATPTIEVDDRNHAACNECGYFWTVKEN